MCSFSTALASELAKKNFFVEEKPSITSLMKKSQVEEVDIKN